jgi:hypothetical protein
MIERLTISKTQSEELEKILSIPEKELLTLAEKLGQEDILTIGELRREIKGGVSQANRELTKQIIALRRYGSKRGVAPDEVLNRLEAGLRHYGWDSEKLGLLTKIRGTIEKILSNESVYLTVKTGELYYDFAAHLHDARIVTDVRPVFDADRDVIKRAIAFSVLKIAYSDQLENEGQLEIVLTLEELEALRIECKRAIKKLNVVSAEIKNKWKIDSLVFEEGFSRDE